MDSVLTNEAVRYMPARPDSRSSWSRGGFLRAILQERGVRLASLQQPGAGLYSLIGRRLTQIDADYYGLN